MLVLRLGRLSLIHHRLDNKLGMMHVLMHICSLLRLLRYDSLTASAMRLHGDRAGQCVAAEQRQPNGQKYYNKFFASGHRHSLTKLTTSVKRN